MKFEDMANWTVDQLKKEVVRLSEECEKKQHEILDLKEKLDIATKKMWCDELISRMPTEEESKPTTKWYDERHQSDCITINQLYTTIDVIIDRYANLRKNKGMC